MYNFYGYLFIALQSKLQYRTGELFFYILVYDWNTFNLPWLENIISILFCCLKHWNFILKCKWTFYHYKHHYKQYTSLF